MNMTGLRLALDAAGINENDLHPQIIISSRFVDYSVSWVVYVAAASVWAFELPGRTEPEKVAEVARAVMLWDVSMAEHERPALEPAELVKWAAGVMSPCPLKELLDSLYGGAGKFKV